MGDCRFLYNNLITDAGMITVSSLRPGLVTGAKKDGTGSAVITVSGNFSGSEDLEYIVEIDSIAGGAEVAQATFKWSDGGGTWDASGVATSAANVTLNNGVNVLWTTGSGADFVVGDAWYFKGINLFNAEKMLDRNRDTRYRSAALGAPNTITVDLGSAQEVEACILMDHNFTSAATLLLEADDADSFDSDGGSAQFSEAMSWASAQILHYLSAAETRRYWRISVTDAGNTDGYIELSELFLGPYVELSANYEEGFTEETEFVLHQNRTPYGIGRDRFFNTRMKCEFSFRGMVASDITALKALITATVSRSLGTLKPFWFNMDSAVVGDTYLVKIESLPVDHMTRSYYEMSIVLEEVVTSV